MQVIKSYINQKQEAEERKLDEKIIKADDLSRSDEPVIIYKQSSAVTTLKKIIRTLFEVVLVLIAIALLAIGAVYVANKNGYSQIGVMDLIEKVTAFIK
jgi:hypothetical protein